MLRPPSAVRLVLFDVGNVLVSLRPATVAFPLGDLPAGAPPAEAIEALRASEVFARFERGKAGAAEFCAEVRRVFSSRRSDEEIARIYCRLLGPPVEGMEEVVREIQGLGLRVAGLSDTSPIHREMILSYPAVAMLERLVTSCETGLLKTSPEAFQAALEVLGAVPGECLFVDDVPRNVACARDAGLKALVFEGVEKLRREMGIGESTLGGMSE
jgi:putative hydrolase of the HAD superfamily